MTLHLQMVREHRYENAALCGPCGGKCCKRMPGSTHPDQWGATNDEKIANVTAALRSGQWAIDWWEGDPARSWDDEDQLSSVNYVRPAMVGVAQIRHAAWGGEGPCVFLGAAGCTLPHDARPIECQQLEPSDGADCINHGDGKGENALAWREFQSVIDAALNEVRA